jgi:tetratricopeptide (TPR) repeat protein
MKKIILSTSLILLLTTGISHAETKTSEQIKAEKVYQDKMDKVKKTLDKANEALSKDYEKYGVFHSKVAEDYKAISEAYFTMGKYDESIEYALHALKVEMKLQKENDPALAKLYFDTGNKYYMHKQHPTAILYMKKAAKIYENSTEKESLVLADTYEGIASTFINLEDFNKSLAYAEKCLDIRKKKLKNEDEALQRAQMNVEYLKKELKKEK